MGEYRMSLWSKTMSQPWAGFITLILVCMGFNRLKKVKRTQYMWCTFQESITPIVFDNFLHYDCSVLIPGKWRAKSCPRVHYVWHHMTPHICAHKAHPHRLARLPLFEALSNSTSVWRAMRKMRVSGIEIFNFHPTAAARWWYGKWRFSDWRQHPFLWVPGMEAKPHWDYKERHDFDWVPEFQKRWREIRDEFLELNAREGIADYNVAHSPEGNQSMHSIRGWKTFHLIDQHGGLMMDNIAKVPKTWALLQSIPRISFHTTMMFSVAMPHGGGMYAHTGYSNMFLRCSLPLINREPHRTFLEVASVRRNLTEGEMIIYDDSFWHAFRNNGDWPRVVLLFDVWHPDILDEELHPVEEQYLKYNTRPEMLMAQAAIQEVNRNSKTEVLDFGPAKLSTSADDPPDEDEEEL
eukprot:gnl/TRDRNA2_/TRDRNA2_56489_c0_seq1.p1 gnl/TRDRNA2_/TRDRNA2_56489_c0~~gnl/TRDRNA2_/TRDRNA2_56489_c0_seq1.p1  ORF type:complete len:408 (+),score=68.96 gnl/TRDRNA2_/TRDRNA2_56489_c0_seq1:89-1312(+)